MLRIDEWRPNPTVPTYREELDVLAEILHATVHAGASVSFILPFSIEDAREFWLNRVLPAVLTRGRRVLLARSDGSICGTVQLDLALPPNQRHRAEIAKLLVHPNARRQGIGRALMEAAEAIARAEGRTLITLDTRTGDSAEPLYQSLGYLTAGVIPNYARDPISPDLQPTTFMYKPLSDTEPAAT
jgi:ribosomal protein S18 acetylase RimI-like enzyme